MIAPRTPQTTAAVAAHYDELDEFYRDIWGEHVHHGYWRSGRETPAEAVVALTSLLAATLDIPAAAEICDIGCGYGASAQYIAEHHGAHVTGLTVSAAQARLAQARRPAAGRLSFARQDWLRNTLPNAAFDRAYAIESSEHMPDQQRFFNETFRTLKPGGIFTICAWLAADRPSAWQIRHLLEPICREGRLPGMGDEADYHRMAQAAGFETTAVQDISRNVSKTWRLCAQRFLRRLASRPAYLKFLFNRREENRIFALTIFRLILAYRTGAMRYCLLTYRKPGQSEVAFDRIT
jgi:tocopherol O-methyltransferase